MLYHSTRSDLSAVDSAQAVLEGLAPDGGLYMPQSIPAFDWQKCLQGSSMDMATDILSALLPDIPDMPGLVKKAYTGKFETDDLTPTAIRRLGAQIISHGVPSQPGNMTLVAYLGQVSILGIPGAAIKLPTTVFDVLLPQIFAGERITKEELIGLADGGL